MEFKQISEVPNFEISDTGIVRKIKTKSIKNGYVSKYGYRRFDFKINGKVRGFLGHRLVATAFIPNPENKPEVNHLDRDRLNNNVGNLEWCTKSENMKHATDSGSFKHKQGRRSPGGKLKEVQVRRIRKMLKNGMTNWQVSRFYNVTRETISNIRNYHTWKNVI